MKANSNHAQDYLKDHFQSHFHSVFSGFRSKAVSSLKKKKRALLLAAALFVCLAAGAAVVYTQLAAPDENDAFDEFCDSLFQSQLSSNTLNLHYTLAQPEDYGIRDYAVTLGGYSMETMRQSMQEVTECVEALNGFDYDALSSDRQLTYDCMRASLETEGLAKNVLQFSELLAPTTGFQAQLPVLLAEYTFYDKQDIEDYLALLYEVSPYFDQIISFEQEKADAGLFMPFYAVEDIVEQCASLLSDRENHFLITTFADRLDELDLTGEERAAYIAENNAALNDSVFPAYESLIASLRMLENTGTNPYGLCYYENGKKYYEYLAAVNTGSDRSVGEMYDMVIAHLQQTVSDERLLLQSHPEVLAKLGQTQQPAGGTSDTPADTEPATAAPEAASDPSAETPDTAVPTTVDPNLYMEDLKEKCAADFPALSDASYTLNTVDECLENYLSPAFYLTPTLDGTAKNVIYINKGHAYTALSLYTTLAHEGFPGHLYQNVYSRSSETAPVRALFGTNGYAEGWATYAEQFAYSYADIDADVAALYQYSSQISLALSAAMDIGIHYYYWTPEDAADFLADYGIADESSVLAMYQYIVEEPANYLNYEIGYLEFLHLRSVAQEALGDEFDLKEFHEALLTIGEAPFSVVETCLRRTLDASK